MSIWTRILAVFKAVPQPELPPALPDDKLRLHLFSADFENADAAMAYCFQSDGDTPEKITLEQPGAFIDTGFVEVAFKGAEKRLTEFLPTKDVDRVIAKMKGVNTLIIITEDAFGGFPYVLTTTKTVFYHGPFVVDV